MKDQDCICGHHSTDHNYSPSGQGVSFCRWSEGMDKYGHPVGNCGCDEYCPQSLDEPCDDCHAEPSEPCKSFCPALAESQDEFKVSTRSWWEGMTCPHCNMEFTVYPALSRKDNKTYICSPCGTNEALLDYVVYLRQKRGVK